MTDHRNEQAPVIELSESVVATACDDSRACKEETANKAKNSRDDYPRRVIRWCDDLEWRKLSRWCPEAMRVWMHNPESIWKSW